MAKTESKNNKTTQKRIEYRGENVRVSRTGGVAATKTFKGDGHAVTLNTKHGVRLHKRLFKGARMGFQNGNFQFIGRYHSGPFNFNVSKTGVSSSIKNKRGSYNFLKPNYSSFKYGGVQVRGKNAATFQMIYMVLILIVNSIKILWHLSVSFIWFSFLAAKWLVDFSIGFVKGFKKPCPMKQRIKHCNVCNVDFSTMYRIQYKNPKEWVFVCEGCLLKVKDNNSAYKYGGTWKK